ARAASSGTERHRKDGTAFSSTLRKRAGTPGTRAFDASEGTRLDPLKNRTYDLGSPKTVPTLSEPAPAPRGRR
ncbi:hypothetical protein OMR07_21785, partial [Methylobacterium organophilum]|nr:hypothetical protein [Methylobacterium organophilum]